MLKPLPYLNCIRLHCDGVPVLTSEPIRDGKMFLGYKYYVYCHLCKIRGPSFNNIDLSDTEAKRKSIDGWIKPPGA